MRVNCDEQQLILKHTLTVFLLVPKWKGENNKSCNKHYRTMNICGRTKSIAVYSTLAYNNNNFTVTTFCVVF